MKKFLFSLLLLLSAITGYHIYSAGLPTEKNISSDKKTSIQQVYTAQWHPQNLERHWGKHRSEFPEYKTAEEYGNAALEFFRSPPKGTLKKIRSNGDRLYYHPNKYRYYLQKVFRLSVDRHEENYMQSLFLLPKNFCMYKLSLYPKPHGSHCKVHYLIFYNYFR